MHYFLDGVLELLLEGMVSAVRTGHLNLLAQSMQELLVQVLTGLRPLHLFYFCGRGNKPVQHSQNK